MQNHEIMEVKTGFRVRRLEAIKRVTLEEGHPLFSSTKLSYLKQGKLWLCKCDCGKQALFSEYVLKAQKVKSCGCIRTENYIDGLSRPEITRKRKEIRLAIKVAQNKLAYLKFTSNVQNNHQALDEVGAELRSLHTQKGHWSPTSVKKRKQAQDIRRDQELRFGVSKTTLPTSAEENPT